jgi:mRNA-degrading endonuclease RelE of RelBE toxin-antitoxin system
MITFKESPIFIKMVRHYLDAAEYIALQQHLVTNPDVGVIIPGSGGLRKLRWKTKGRGKRGGYRVIYYWRKQQYEIWLLTMYAKTEVENIPAHLLRALKEELKDE